MNRYEKWALRKASRLLIARNIGEDVNEAEIDRFLFQANRRRILADMAISHPDTNFTIGENNES